MKVGQVISEKDLADRAGMMGWDKVCKQSSHSQKKMARTSA
jgi:hypothetical protein